MLEKEKRALDEAETPSANAPSADESAAGEDPVGYDESIVEELSALVDDAGLYATAEIAFQKTRAKLAGASIAKGIIFVILALILLHIAIIAMAVGLVIALAPIVTIWGAIAIVVGAMLLGVALLIWRAVKSGKIVASLFSSEPSAPENS